MDNDGRHQRGSSSLARSTPSRPAPVGNTLEGDRKGIVVCPDDDPEGVDMGRRSGMDGFTFVGTVADGEPFWWFSVRPSNTEPLLRLNVEAADDATMSAIRDEVLALIRA